MTPFVTGMIKPAAWNCSCAAANHTVHPERPEMGRPISTTEETGEKKTDPGSDGNQILHVLGCNWRLIFGATLQKHCLQLVAPDVAVLPDSRESQPNSMPHNPSATRALLGPRVPCPPRKEGWSGEMAASLIPNPNMKTRLSSSAASPKAGEQQRAAGRGNPKATETVRPGVFPSVFGFLIPL